MSISIIIEKPIFCTFFPQLPLFNDGFFCAGTEIPSSLSNGSLGHYKFASIPDTLRKSSPNCSRTMLFLSNQHYHHCLYMTKRSHRVTILYKFAGVFHGKKNRKQNTSKMMQNNRSCNSHIQGGSATPILRNIYKEVAYFIFLGR